MGKRADHNFISIMIYTVMVYIVLTPFLFLYGVTNFIGILSLFCFSLLIGSFFGFLNSIIIELRKVNGEKFPHLEDKIAEDAKRVLAKMKKREPIDDHIQFRYDHLSPLQQEKFDAWELTLPWVEKSQNKFQYIYENGAGIGVCLTVRRLDGEEIDLTEYDKW